MTASERIRAARMMGENNEGEERMIARRVRAGNNEQQSREILAQLKLCHSPTTIDAALAYWGFTR